MEFVEIKSLINFVKITLFEAVTKLFQLYFTNKLQPHIL